MKKILIRIVLIILLSLIFLVINFILQPFLLNNMQEPVKISFQMPFPEDIMKKYKLIGYEDYLVIDKVYITGFFADWNPTNAEYLLKQTQSNLWEIMLKLEPGNNQYKFVVLLKDDDTLYWVHDQNNTHQTDDAFGGFNSVYTIFDPRPLLFILNVIVLGIVLILSLFFLLEPITHWIMHLKIGFRLKLILSVFLIGVVSNFLFIAYNVFEERELTKQSFVDSANWIHSYLISQGVDFREEFSNENREKISVAMKRLFSKMRARVEKDTKSNIQTMISAIALLDKNYEYIEGFHRDEFTVILEGHLSNFQVDIKGYYMQILFSNVIEKARIEKTDKMALFDRFASYYQSDPELLITQSALGYTTMLYPIHVGRKTAGYYALYINPRLFGSEIIRLILFNLFLIPIVGILVFLLLRNIGGVVTDNITRLINGIRLVQDGNLDHPIAITTHDELQILSESYNYMRLGLKEMNRLKEEFLSNTSHELQTPITTIYGALEMLTAGDIDLTNHEELSLIHKTLFNDVKALKKIIQNFIVLTSVDKSALFKKEIYVKEFLSRFFQNTFQTELKDAVEQKRLTIRYPKFEADIDGCSIKTDLEYFSHLLFELLHNAVTYNREGGTISLKVEKEANQLKISVEDSGIGIEKEYIPKIYETFFRIDKYNSSSIAGIGLGLSSVKMIADRLGYSINVESEPNRGSVFTLTINLNT